MKSLLPKLPKFEVAMPDMPTPPSFDSAVRRLQGHFGVLGRQYGKFANTMRPTKQNGGRPWA